MGLGKTLQVIAALSDSGGQALSPALIVAPGSLLENWRREIEKFAPHLRVLKHHGALRTGRPVELKGYDVVITSYDNAVGDNSLLNMILWKVVILDEAQFIRNPNAQRTKAVKRLRRDAGLAMTGIYLTVDVRLDALLKLRTEFNKALEPDGVRLSVNDLLIKALAKALIRVPKCNVSFAGDELRNYSRADISVAVAAPSGLITPIIVDAAAKGVAQISTEMKALADKARDGKLMPHEYQGGTASLCLCIRPFDFEALRTHLEAFGINVAPPEMRFGARGFAPSIFLTDPEGNGIELKSHVTS